MSDSRLFRPIKLGNIELQHRIAMAPLTRYRADEKHVHQPMAVEYYAQRASVPGTLLVTEATFVSPEAGGYAHVPGIYNQEQIDAWKKVTDAVHSKGSFIYLQLWDLGRVASPDVAKKEGITIRGPSAIPSEKDAAAPKEMDISEIKESIANYAKAAKNAIAAGFDGVEIHAANGYLIDQFIQDNSNQRTDEYGGSVENRSRFAIEVTQAVVEAVGAERTGIRLSPFSPFQGMKMKDPLPQFTNVIKQLSTFNLAYLHLVEARISGNVDIGATDALDPLLDVWNGPLLIAGGFKLDSAKQFVDERHPNKDIVIAFGRYFISTPDLAFRLKKGIELTPYNRDTFYLPMKEEGYIDYQFSKEFSTAVNA